MENNFPTSTSLMKFTAGYVGLIGTTWIVKPSLLEDLMNPVVKSLGLVGFPASFPRDRADILVDDAQEAVRVDPALAAFTGPMLVKMAMYCYNASERGGDDGFLKYGAFGRVLMSICWLINWYRGVLPSGYLVFAPPEMLMALLTYKAMKEEKRL